MEFQSALVADRTIEGWRHDQEEPNLQGVDWSRFASTAELSMELARMAGRRPEETYGVGKSVAPGVQDLYESYHKPDHISVGKQMTLTPDAATLERESRKIGLIGSSEDINKTDEI